MHRKLPRAKGLSLIFQPACSFFCKIMLVHRNIATSIEKYWDIMANTHVIAKFFFYYLEFLQKMYIPSTIKTQIIILMTGANNNGGSWVIWRHGKIICYCLGPWYMNIVPSFFCADLGLQGRTAIFLKVSYFWELDFLHRTQS